jgi:hypothetical protein
LQEGSYNLDQVSALSALLSTDEAVNAIGDSSSMRLKLNMRLNENETSNQASGTKEAVSSTVRTRKHKQHSNTSSDMDSKKRVMCASFIPSSPRNVPLVLSTASVLEDKAVGIYDPIKALSGKDVMLCAGISSSAPEILKEAEQEMMQLEQLHGALCRAENMLNYLQCVSEEWESQISCSAENLRSRQELYDALTQNMFSDLDSIDMGVNNMHDYEVNSDFSDSKNNGRKSKSDGLLLAGGTVNQSAKASSGGQKGTSASSRRKAAARRRR